MAIPSPQHYQRSLVSHAMEIDRAQPNLTYAYLWLPLANLPNTALLPPVAIARRSILGSPVGRIDHGALDERFTFGPPGRRGSLADSNDDPRERVCDTYLRELFGPAAVVLLDAPDVFVRLGIVDDRLYVITAIDAVRIERAADLLLELRAALPQEVLRRFGS